MFFSGNKQHYAIEVRQLTQSRAVENSIWKGEKRSLSMTGKAFQKLGSSSAV
jgi:hypothetical protein